MAPEIPARVSDESPLITTVIPTFRRPQLLLRAISSAIEQEGGGVRVSVFDNCSDDETAGVVAALAARHSEIKFFSHPSNVGASANFEFGVRSVTTPFFSILSDDDYLLPGFYRRALEGLKANPEAMFWAGMTLNVDEGGTIWDARVQRWPKVGVLRPPEGVMAMTGGLAPLWTGIVFRREVLDVAGFIDPETRGPSDLDFLIRLASRFPYGIEKMPAAVFTLNSQGFSSTEPLSSFWPGWQKMFSNVQKLDVLDPVDRGRLLDALRADAKKLLFRRAVNAVSAKRYAFALDAASVLESSYSSWAAAATLRAMAFACANIPGAQSAMSACYQAAESRIVRSRQALQDAYGHLLRQ